MDDERRIGRTGSDHDGFVKLDLTTHQVRQPRRARIMPVAILLASALAGGTTGYLAFSLRSDAPPPPPQQLSGAAPLPSPEPSASVLGTIVERSDDGDRRAHRSERGEKRKDKKRSTVRLRVKPKKRTSSPPVVSAPAPVQPAPAPAPAPEQGGKEKPRKERKPPLPDVYVYHLYKKADRHHFFTIDANFAGYARKDGYKDRLSPGYVFTKQHEGTVRVPVSIQDDYYYDNNVPSFVYAKDQGADTYPLWHLTGKQGREMVTSWQSIRDSWVSKGWIDNGVVGYIYRPD